jgi:hypothetical protein
MSFGWRKLKGTYEVGPARRITLGFVGVVSVEGTSVERSWKRFGVGVGFFLFSTGWGSHCLMILYFSLLRKALPSRWPREQAATRRLEDFFGNAHSLGSPATLRHAPKLGCKPPGRPGKKLVDDRAYEADMVEAAVDHMHTHTKTDTN